MVFAADVLTTSSASTRRLDCKVVVLVVDGSDDGHNVSAHQVVVVVAKTEAKAKRGHYCTFSVFSPSDKIKKNSCLWDQRGRFNLFFIICNLFSSKWDGL